MGVEKFGLDILPGVPALEGFNLVVGFAALKAALQKAVARMRVWPKGGADVANNGFFVGHWDALQQPVNRAGRPAQRNRTSLLVAS